MRLLAILVRLLLAVCVSGTMRPSYEPASTGTDAGVRAGEAPVVRPLPRAPRLLAPLVVARTGARINRAALPHQIPLAVLATGLDIPAPDAGRPATGSRASSRRLVPRPSASLRGPPPSV